MPRVVAAIDKFRGTLTARQAAEAVAMAAGRAGWDCDLIPLSDGGEGFLDVFASWGTVQQTRVAGPLGQPVEARWVLGRDPENPGQVVAIIESALVIGITLAGGPSANDPVRATSEGVGQLVLAAVKAGAKQVVIGVGGSATTDGGLGAVEVLAPQGRPPAAELLVACDVETKFLDAAPHFAPQKGAGPKEVALLERRLERVAQLYQERFHVDVRDLPGSGASGGLSGGLVAIGAKLMGGFELVADRLGLAERIAGADLVVTGEGYLDRQSFAGKTVGGVVGLAAGAGAPVLIVAGNADPGVGHQPYVSLVDRYGPERAFASPAACISEVVEEHLKRDSMGGIIQSG